jgi:hypothetical protein
MPKAKLIITIIVIFILLAIIAFAIFSIMKQKVSEKINSVSINENIDSATANILNENNSGNDTSNDLNNDINNNISEPVVLSEQEKVNGFLIKTSSAFSERFGSYSNQSNFENLLDLKMLMTEKMQNWVDSLIVKGGSQNAVYYGITTKALNTNIKNSSESVSEVIVSTQRQESVGSEINSKIYYQDLIIIFTKEGGLWKVDSAIWQ